MDYSAWTGMGCPARLPDRNPGKRRRVLSVNRVILGDNKVVCCDLSNAVVPCTRLNFTSYLRGERLSITHFA